MEQAIESQDFTETQFVDWAFNLTMAEFIASAQKAESHTRQRMIGQLEGALTAIRIAANQ